MCGIYHCIVCTSNLDPFSFLFVPTLYSTLKFKDLHTGLHEHAYMLLLWYECVLFTNKVWEFNFVTRFTFYCTTKFCVCQSFH